MIDKDSDNDEYKFVESEFQSDKPLEDSSADAGTSSKFGTYGAAFYKPSVRRNAIIAIGLVLFLFLLYELFSSKSKPKIVHPSLPAAEVPLQPTTTAAETPVNAPTVQPADPDLKEKVAAIETNQQSVSSQVTSVSQQLGTVNTTVNNLNDEVNKLNQTLSNLANQVEKQSQEIKIILLRSRPKPMRVNMIPESERIVYFIKAIIPGRAWLIGSNGSTLSIREGIRLNGYGVVKLIDSIQGRVITSSGKIIRFSQDDS